LRRGARESTECDEENNELVSIDAL
jgi:hypothetical protein